MPGCRFGNDAQKVQIRRQMGMEMIMLWMLMGGDRLVVGPVDQVV